MPQDRPRTVQRSTPWSARNASMSAMRWAVVLVLRSASGCAGQRPAAPAAALVEQDGAVGVRIEEAPLARRAARAGAAVQVERGLASGVAAALPIDLMPVAHVEHAAVVRLNRRESVVLHSAPLHCLSDRRLARDALLRSSGGDVWRQFQVAGRGSLDGG